MQLSENYKNIRKIGEERREKEEVKDVLQLTSSQHLGSFAQTSTLL